MEWYEITISVTSETKDSVTNRLFELGAEGVSESLADANILQAYYPKDLKDGVVSELQIYWASLQEIFPKLSALNLKAAPLKNENWAERYKEFYYAQSLSDLFYLRPVWDTQTPIPNGMIPIIMEPGQAFGTGLHPSTRLCLKMLQSQLIQNARRTELECLDVGTGTGILAIVAKKLGVKKVVGIDNDPVAVEVAKENIKINSEDDIELSAASLSTFKKPFDFLISNILLETHRELAIQYSRLVPQGGCLLLSGLLGYQKKELCDFILPLGFVLLESRNSQEWAAYLFLRREIK